MSIDRGMDKEIVVHKHNVISLNHKNECICASCDELDKAVVHIYTMEYYSAIKRNTVESVLMRWMDLEPIIQSQVSQIEKDKYHILTHIYMESRKMVLKNLLTGQQWRNRHRE